MAFPQSFLDELVARSDIVDVVGSYVALTKKGANYFGLCPFHNEKTGSFSVSPDKQIYHCFGCKKGGGVISFIMEEENLSFPDAVRFLAKRANLPVPEEEQGEGSRLRARLLELNRDAARFYYDQLYSPKGAPVLEYMKNRKITRRNATNFGLGASADEWDGLLTAMRKKGYGDGELLASGLAIRGKNGGLYDKFRKRLIFPIIDVRGDVGGVRELLGEYIRTVKGGTIEPHVNNNWKIVGNNWKAADHQKAVQLLREGKLALNENADARTLPGKAITTADIAKF